MQNKKIIVNESKIVECIYLFLFIFNFLLEIKDNYNKANNEKKKGINNKNQISLWSGINQQRKRPLLRVACHIRIHIQHWFRYYRTPFSLNSASIIEERHGEGFYEVVTFAYTYHAIWNLKGSKRWLAAIASLNFKFIVF